MRKKFFVPLVGMALSFACAKIVVVKVTPDLNAEGVFYALPRTVARVQVKLDKTARVAAPYSHFAAIFAPDGQPACKDKEEKPEDDCVVDKDKPGPRKSTAYSVQQGATFSTFGEPDPAEIYLIEFAGSAAVDQTMSMTWNEAGLLSAASASATNRTTDIVLAGVKMAAGLGTKAAYGAANAETIKPDEGCPDKSDTSNNDKWVLTVLNDPSLGTSRATLAANYCDIPAKPAPGRQGRDDFQEAVDRPLLIRAASAYALRVLPHIKARTKLLSGDSQALDPLTLVNKIEQLIDQELKALFLGKTTTTTWEGAIDVRGLKVGENLPVLGVLKHQGICVDKAALAPDAKRFPEGFALVTDQSQCKAATPVSLVLDYYPAAADQLFTAVAKTREPGGQRSFRYRIPAQVRAVLMDGSGDTLGGGVFSIAQLGKVVSLPARRHSKTMSYDLAMIEATGGLKSFKLGSTGGLDAATIDALSGAGGTVLDARNAASKAAATRADELTALTREQALLKLKDEICDIQKKYGLTCTVQP